MRQARDTFLKYLANNVVGYPVRNLRKDPNNPKLSLIQEGYVNVEFIGDELEVAISNLTALIDVVNADELTAIDMMKAVWNLLATNTMAPLQDWTNPNAPTALVGNIFWPATIRFRPVASDTYFRYSAQLTISYHIQ